MSCLSDGIRPTRSLNGVWEFEFLGNVQPEEVRPDQARFEQKMLVPSAFDAMPAYAGKRGVAVYRTRFAAPVDKRLRVVFSAVSLWCRVFVDGVLCGENACGYVPFSVELPRSMDGDRELVVVVDNRFDFDRVPMHEEYFDFYQYGGIVRDVTLHELPLDGPFIEWLHVTPTEGYREGEVEIKVTLGGRVEGRFGVAIQFDGRPLLTRQAEAAKGGLRLIMKVPEAKLWSPRHPSLHSLRLALLDARGEEIDDRAVRFGLRRIEARDGALWLNGEPIKLRGYNRHEWHPNFGPCTPRLQMMNDLQLLRDLGCNFVRGAHYPQDQHFLDLCDELGFLVWEENLGWGQRKRTFENERWKRQHRESLRSMIETSHNHPSVIIWGFLNEAASNEEYTRGVYEETVRFIKDHDRSRLVSYGTNVPEIDRHYDLVDLIGINIYPGWYGCENVERPLDVIVPEIRRILEVIDEKGFQGKPVIISEIGAEGLYGWRDPHHDFFSEEYQAAYLERACTEAMASPRCSGVAVWQFTDGRTYGGARALIRPRAFNNKGTLDEYRRPKAAYQVVREIFNRFKTDPCP